jgi:uncharacterized protein YukE
MGGTLMGWALPRPGGEPGQIERFAGQLAGAGGSMGGVAASIYRQAAQVREQAQWAGGAAETYTGFTSGLSRAVGTLENPLVQASASLADFAGVLRIAQQRVDAYNSAYQSAAAAAGDPLGVAAGHPVPGLEITTAGAELPGLQHDAQVALAALDEQVSMTARTLGRIAGEMTKEFFGPEGPFRNFLEKAHLPWDAAAGDALIEHFIEGGEAAEKAIEDFKDLPGKIKQLQEDMVAPVADEVEAGGADARTNLKTMLQALGGYQLKKGETIADVRRALAEADPALAGKLNGLKAVATEADLAGSLAGVYTAASPPQGDKGLWRAADHVAGFGAAAGSAPAIAKNAFGVDFGKIGLGPVDSLEFVPELGTVVTTAAGVYLTVDWVVHHPAEAHYILSHPYDDGCNLLGNMFGKGVWKQAGCAPPPVA